MLCKIRSQDEEKVLSDFDRCFFDTVLYGNVSNCKCCAKNTWKSKNGKCVFWIRIANIRLTQVHVTWDKTTNYSQMDYPSQNEYSRGWHVMDAKVQIPKNRMWMMEFNEYYVFKAVGWKEYDLSPAVFLSE